VDEVSEERDRARQDEDRHLGTGGEGEHGEADRDGLDALVRPDYRAIDEPVRVAVPAPAVRRVILVVV